MAFGLVELVVVLLVVVLVEPTPVVSAFVGAVRTPEEGVYGAAVVVAFEPAADDPEDAYDDDAPGPDPPEEVLA